MNDFVLLQNYARNLLMRYFLGCTGVLDERHGKTVVPWAIVKQQLGGELIDLRCVP